MAFSDATKAQAYSRAARMTLSLGHLSERNLSRARKTCVAYSARK